MNVDTIPEKQGKERSSAFWRYWAASTISTTGSGATSLALPLVALTVLDVSNFEMGVLTAVGYAAIIVMGLPAGVIAQRFALRSLQVSMDLFRFAAIATIPLAAWWDMLTLPHLLVVAFFVGMANNVFDVANSTFLPGIVPTSQLIARNGLMSSTVATTQLVGPSLGGLLVQAVGAAFTMVIDAISYLVSALLLSSIRITGTRPPISRKPLFREMGTGLRFVFSHPIIRVAALYATAVNFANGVIFAVLAPFLVRTLGLEPAFVGLVFALDGVGSVLGAAVTARVARRFGTAPALLLTATAGAVFVLAMPLAVTGYAPAIFGFGLGAFAFSAVVASVITRTHRQTASPPELLSRVMASVRFVSWSVIPIGSVTAGLLAEVWSPRVALVEACVAVFIGTLLLWFSPVRGLRELSDLDSQQAVAQPLPH
ncbi:MFS transporter [Actinoplanes regularis]|uniref:Predicted arabinose efflux permease, MFS family n=1 Tax=Actinoplanes regularis TaxID=52697 RepID=A0A238X6H8_9ACTN|nr:MFS transporter [Actinoplanes regularis]GIE86446.1 MFS transporter [Actinoplanes regularis]SNR53944.1 Predicted arabinose efflux permease, MFS family [Actinoplanes regularis]